MKILEVELLTDDLNQTLKFYQEILGMELLYTNDSVVKFSAGFSVLTFKKTNNQNPFYHFAFTIPANKFEEAYAWAKAKLQLIPVTPASTIADFKSWNAKAFYFYDNNQNIVEFIARFDLENNSDKPFGGSSIFSISEIGIVVGNAKTYSEKILKDYGLNFFSKQAPKDDFVAIGDDQGLFIVVNDKRNWYPTQTPSKKYWTALKAEHNGQLIAMEISVK